jgi:hypothetical protein
MKESVTYQAIVEEGVEKGRLEEARQALLDDGAQRLGKPSDDIDRAIVDIEDDAQVVLHARRIHGPPKSCRQGVDFVGVQPRVERILLENGDRAPCGILLGGR